jgi:hypothetical protein
LRRQQQDTWKALAQHALQQQDTWKELAENASDLVYLNKLMFQVNQVSKVLRDTESLMCPQNYDASWPEYVSAKDTLPQMSIQDTLPERSNSPMYIAAGQRQRGFQNMRLGQAPVITPSDGIMYDALSATTAEIEAVRTPAMRNLKATSPCPQDVPKVPALRCSLGLQDCASNAASDERSDERNDANDASKMKRRRGGRPRPPKSIREAGRRLAEMLTSAESDLAKEEAQQTFLKETDGNANLFKYTIGLVDQISLKL